MCTCGVILGNRHLVFSWHAQGLCAFSIRPRTAYFSSFVTVFQKMNGSLSSIDSSFGGNCWGIQDVWPKNVFPPVPPHLGPCQSLEESSEAKGSPLLIPQGWGERSPTQIMTKLTKASFICIRRLCFPKAGFKRWALDMVRIRVLCSSGVCGFQWGIGPANRWDYRNRK